MESAPQEKAPSGAEVSLSPAQSPLTVFPSHLSLEVPFPRCSFVLCPPRQRPSSANRLEVFILGTASWLLPWLSYPPSPVIYLVPEAAFSCVGICTNPTSSVAASLICESMFTSPPTILYGFTSFQMDSSALPVASTW